jgi:Fe(3+) dicitrate transport protein
MTWAVAVAAQPAVGPGASAPSADAAPPPVPAGPPAPSSAAETPARAAPQAQPSEPDAAGDDALVSDEPEDEVVVFADRLRRTPGSVQVVGSETLQRYKYDDPHATLQLVPGVYVRQEDGFGLRPNIGIRGAISDRSQRSR